MMQLCRQIEGVEGVKLKNSILRVQGTDCEFAIHRGKKGGGPVATAETEENNPIGGLECEKDSGFSSIVARLGWFNLGSCYN